MNPVVLLITATISGLATVLTQIGALALALHAYVVVLVQTFVVAIMHAIVKSQIPSQPPPGSTYPPCPSPCPYPGYLRGANNGTM